MDLIERLEDAGREYLIYPSIALIPGRYQPKVFEKLSGTSGKEMLTQKVLKILLVLEVL